MSEETPSWSFVREHVERRRHGRTLLALVVSQPPVTITVLTAFSYSGLLKLSVNAQAHEVSAVTASRLFLSRALIEANACRNAGTRPKARARTNSVRFQQSAVQRARRKRGNFFQSIAASPRRLLASRVNI